MNESVITMSSELKILSEVNKIRQQEWDPNNTVDLAYRGNELAGETGEACNVIKKLIREQNGMRGSRATKEDLADELADVVICVSLVAVQTDIDLWDAICKKFNKTSDKYGLKTKI